MPYICFVLHTTGQEDISSTHESDSLKCFHDATNQLEHDGQVQPQECITGKERLILDVALNALMKNNLLEATHVFPWD